MKEKNKREHVSERCDLPRKRELMRYSFMKQLSVEEDKIVINKKTREPIEIDYQHIKMVKNVSANLCILLDNGAVYKLSTISTDVKVELPCTNRSTCCVLWWLLSGWFCSWFRHK